MGRTFLRDMLAGVLNDTQTLFLQYPFKFKQNNFLNVAFCTMSKPVFPPNVEGLQSAVDPKGFSIMSFNTTGPAKMIMVGGSTDPECLSRKTPVEKKIIG